MLVNVLLALGLTGQVPYPHKRETISVRGRTIAGIDQLTGYLRGGFGDQYQIFIFGREPSKAGGSVMPIKIAYKFFKSESPLPDTFLDFSKLYDLQVLREPSCDETVQSLSYQKKSDQTGKALPSAYILRLLKGAPENVLSPDMVLACYIMRPVRYKIVAQGVHD